MVENEVTLLKTENENQALKLREDDWGIIKNIMKSMSIFKVNSYDRQVIQRDLIGMAQESRLRDSCLQEAIGDDVKGFANEIINNSNGPCIREIGLNFLSKLSAYFCCWFILLVFSTYGSLTWEASPSIYFFYTGVVLILFIVEGIITPLFSTEKGFKKNLPALISVLLFAILGVINYLLRENEYTRVVNGGYIIVGSGMVYLITKCFNRRNIHRLTKGKKNYIEDLI